MISNGGAPLELELLDEPLDSLDEDELPLEALDALDDELLLEPLLELLDWFVLDELLLLVELDDEEDDPDDDDWLELELLALETELEDVLEELDEGLLDDELLLEDDPLDALLELGAGGGGSTGGNSGLRLRLCGWRRARRFVGLRLARAVFFCRWRFMSSPHAPREDSVARNFDWTSRGA